MSSIKIGFVVEAELFLSPPRCSPASSHSELLERVYLSETCPACHLSTVSEKLRRIRHRSPSYPLHGHGHMVTNMAYMHACACACAYACTCSLDEICAATRDARDGSVHIHASMRGSGSRALSRDGNSRTSRAPEARRHAMSHARLRATEREAAWQVAENLVHLCACLGELSASQGEVVPRLHTR